MKCAKVKKLGKWYLGGVSVQKLDKAMSGFVANSPDAAGAFRQSKEKATKGGSLSALSASWPDAIGRQRVTANYGTNGGQEVIRPAVAPARKRCQGNGVRVQHLDNSLTESATPFAIYFDTP